MSKIAMLQKGKADTENPRNDNADKLPLFGKDEHLKAAKQHQEDWSFIVDLNIRRNISYQLQYLEFLVNLYNKYQFYLVLESMTFKTIILTVASIVEAALLDLVRQSGQGSWSPDTDAGFAKCLSYAEDMQILDRDLRQRFESLRRLRNNIHLASIGTMEYQEYDVGETNLYIVGLNNLYLRLNS
ncbi:MAG: hypothetical protein KBC02_02205 [Candidatus Pacebacteria bacterium]|nr:hypothetical protein [Candidatus Paceibacterota bacterium]